MDECMHILNIVVIIFSDLSLVLNPEDHFQKMQRKKHAVYDGVYSYRSQSVK